MKWSLYLLSYTVSVLIGSFSNTQPKKKSSGDSWPYIHGLFGDLLGKGVTERLLEAK